MSPSVAMTLGLIAAVAAIVLLYVKVLPKKLDGRLDNNILQILHDYFHFKRLFIEDIMKFFFILLSVCCITIGFFLLFSSYSYSSYYYSYSKSFFMEGLILMIAGPVILRICYEMIMMTILMVQNIIDINKKMDKLVEKKDNNNVYQQ